MKIAKKKEATAIKIYEAYFNTLLEKEHQKAEPLLLLDLRRLKQNSL